MQQANIIVPAGNDKQLATTLLLIEQLPKLVEEQVKAISNLKIDKVTVWDSGSGGNGEGKSSTANFLSGLASALPPVHELTKNAGIELPEILGKLKKDAQTNENVVEAKNPAANPEQA